MIGSFHLGQKIINAVMHFTHRRKQFSISSTYQVVNRLHSHIDNDGDGGDLFVQIELQRTRGLRCRLA